MSKPTVEQVQAELLKGGDPNTVLARIAGLFKERPETPRETVATAEGEDAPRPRRRRRSVADA